MANALPGTRSHELHQSLGLERKTFAVRSEPDVGAKQNNDASHICSGELCLVIAKFSIENFTASFANISHKQGVQVLPATHDAPALQHKSPERQSMRKNSDT